MSTASYVQSLVALGLNTLEAEVYCDLLRSSPETGYGVAKGLGKPAANVYKALESLQGKGAVEVDEGEKKHYRAVPVAEFLRQLEREFDEHSSRAANALSGLPKPQEDSRIYQIRSRDQVFERARQMLARAEQLALLDVFPLPATELCEDIERCAARGVLVVAKTYSPTSTFGGVRTVLEPTHENVLKRWPGQWVNVYIDGAEFLLALLEQDGPGVVQAIWSESPQLSWNFHSTFGCELGFTELKTKFLDNSLADELRQTFEDTRSYMRNDLPGYKRLLETLGGASERGPDVH